MMRAILSRPKLRTTRNLTLQGGTPYDRSMLDTLAYLNQTYLTEDQICEKSALSPALLHKWQDIGSFPRPSYRSQVTHQTSSFFGEFQETAEIRYYPVAYLSWIGFLRAIDGDPKQAREVFRERYFQVASELFQSKRVPSRFLTDSGKLDEPSVEDAINSDWKSFLEGTYGLCTRTGLPEDIAAKEFSTHLIDQITEKQTKKDLSPDEKETLCQAVALLDRSASLFAPHERSRASRHRCITQVRQIYRLPL